jgi:hypothetical protein
MGMTEVQAPQRIVDYIIECWGFVLYDQETEDQIYDRLYAMCPEVDIWRVWFNEDTNKLTIIAEFKDPAKATWWILKWVG